MLHFVYNLQYYIMFEVLEVSWSAFVERVQKAQDLGKLRFSIIPFELID